MQKTFYISFRIFSKRSIGLHVNPYRKYPRPPVIEPFLVKIRNTKQALIFHLRDSKIPNYYLSVDILF